MANKRNQAVVAAVADQDQVRKKSLFLMLQTLIKRFMAQKIFGWSNSMLHGADIVKL